VYPPLDVNIALAALAFRVGVDAGGGCVGAAVVGNEVAAVLGQRVGGGVSVVGALDSRFVTGVWVDGWCSGAVAEADPPVDLRR
jgi:hypothetical protein